MKNLPYIFFLILFSCGVPKENPPQENPPQEDIELDITPRIIFINYKIEKEEEGSVQVELINKIIVEGEFKNNPNTIINPSPKDFKCIQVSENGTKIEHVFIKNPLVKIIEYVGDNGELQKKTVEQGSADINIRMMLNPKAKSIILEEIGISNRELLKIQL